jgi:multiple sugar transport system substrate-binding protein
MALGHATGDSGWTQWLIWAFGAALVDKNNKVIIDSAETLKALEYGKELYATFIPGTLSWLDPNNNKAFLDSQISSPTTASRSTTRPRTRPTPRSRNWRPTSSTPPSRSGPVGVPTEYHLFFNQMVFKHTKYPKAAKEFVRFMMEEEQFGPWMQAAGGYISQPLRAYEKNAVWTVDPSTRPTATR